MSTRSSIYFTQPTDGSPSIHIYYEMLDDAPNDVHMEILIPYAAIDILLPVDLQQRMGIQRHPQQLTIEEVHGTVEIK